MGIWRAGVEGKGLQVWDWGLHKLKQRQEDNRRGNRAIDGDHAEDCHNDSRSEAKPNLKGQRGMEYHKRGKLSQKERDYHEGKRFRPLTASRAKSIIQIMVPYKGPFDNYFSFFSFNF